MFQTNEFASRSENVAVVTAEKINGVMTLIPQREQHKGGQCKAKQHSDEKLRKKSESPLPK
jgi:hypothetical protein